MRTAESKHSGKGTLGFREKGLYAQISCCIDEGLYQSAVMTICAVVAKSKLIICKGA